MQKEPRKKRKIHALKLFFPTVSQVVQNWTLNNFVLLALIYLRLYLKYSE